MRDAKAIGRSVPSGMMWEITAPMPYADASPAILSGSEGL